ncbi:MAG: Gfo/Idh/MocA family protein, partial [Verrucomicrobiales bacterium]
MKIPIEPNAPTLKSTRRKFLGTSAAAGAVAALPASLSAQVEGNSTLKLALIGCGGRGTGAANQNLTTEGTKLVAMADVFRGEGTDSTGIEKALENLNQRHKDKIDVPDENKFVGFDGYLKAIEVADIVILTTPPGFRPMMIEAAVEAGKHIFSEKPVCVDAPGYRRVLAAAKKADEKGLKCVVGLQRHYQKSYLETLAKIKSGMIGDIVSAQVWWNGAGVWVRNRQPEDTEMRYQCRNWYYFN